MLAKLPGILARAPCWANEAGELFACIPPAWGAHTSRAVMVLWPNSACVSRLTWSWTLWTHFGRVIYKRQRLLLGRSAWWCWVIIVLGSSRWITSRVRSKHLQVPDLVRQLSVIPFDLSHHFMSGHPRTVFTCLYKYSLAGHRIFKINLGMSSKLNSKKVFILICCWILSLLLLPLPIPLPLAQTPTSEGGSAALLSPQSWWQQASSAAHLNHFMDKIIISCIAFDSCYATIFRDLLCYWAVPHHGLRG